MANLQSTYGPWKIIERIGEGGNGTVYRVEKSGTIAALKVLKTSKREDVVAYQRFSAEINTIKSNADIAGLIPIIDSYLPRIHNSRAEPWYVMPIADQIKPHQKNKSAKKVIKEFIPLLETFVQLHDRKIAHRDVKPANLLLYEGRICISDFGLVDYPDRGDLTRRNESVGPKWTMAPEMRRQAAQADGLPADIYSLAKTLWILLTEVTQGFDGQYVVDSVNSISHYYKKIYSGTLDELLEQATQDDPVRRPTAKEFLKGLREWLQKNNTFHRRNLSQWEQILERIFPVAMPESASWTSLKNIRHILSTIASVNNGNHMHLLDGGGLDLEGVAKANENGCLELRAGGLPKIVKPHLLTFDSFGLNKRRWSYFRLETLEMPRFDLRFASSPIGYEELLEYGSQNYQIAIDRPDMSESGEELDGNEKIRRVIRYYASGVFLIVAKRSPYNLHSWTYDGRHNGKSQSEFRTYIKQVIVTQDFADPHD